MKHQVGHIFHGEFPHLVKFFGVSFASETPIKGRIYLTDGWGLGEAKIRETMPQVFEQEDLPIILSLLPLVLSSPYLNIRRLKCLLHRMFTFQSFCHLIKGPKILIFHGMNVSFFAGVVLRLCGKKMIYIHWGGEPYDSFLARLIYNLYARIVVLMTPELSYFAAMGFAKKTICQSYCRKEGTPFLEFGVSNNPKILILGNSTWSRENYRQVLDKMRKDHGWEKIICMLNYGDEKNVDITNAFIEEYAQKLGSAFTPWREHVPYNEYIKTMREAEYYVCPTPVQTGLGALHSSIYMGKTCLVTGDNLSWISNLGVTAINTNEVADFSYEALTKLRMSNEAKIKNREKLIAFYRTQTFDLWRKTVFADFL